jgi:hypothetical protein
VDRLSLTTGYAYFTNWIDQDITTGFRFNPVETSRWSYGGVNQVFSFDSIFAWTPAVNLIAGVEWDRGNNSFSVPPSTTGADWSQLPIYSDVIVETIRIKAGIDYEIRSGIGCYFRYNYFDYADLGQNLYSGTANFFLAGVNAIY